ncbi:MAG: HAD family hydrolase [Actinomycetota bacterium]|nr:HAD family hydrolase [Actinomycetota bacterium]
MARTRACLVDVYDTIVSCDFLIRRNEMAMLAGVEAQAWREGYQRYEYMLNTGQLTKAEGFELILRGCGAEPRPDLVRALLDKDRELLFATTRLYDDVLPFLTGLRSRDIKIAIVSNCGEYTRELLVELGVAALADALVLSCEVGAAKPAAEIFRHALDQLGVSAGTALFVDDQPGYCAGAVALGIAAVRIERGEPAGLVPAAETAAVTTVVRSLPEVEALL